MATERLSFDIFANLREDGFAKAGRAASAASDDVMALGKRLDEIGRKSETARLGLVGDKEATAELDKFDLKLLTTGRRVVDPKITLGGAAKAAAEISALDAGLDKLSRKVATPRVGGIGGIGGAAGGAAGGAGGVASSGASAASGAGPLLTNPWVIGGGIAAALAALPFAAQAASAGIVTILGGGLATLAVIGAAKLKEVRDDFGFLGKGAESALNAISAPFKTVLISIEGTAQATLSALVGPLTSAIKTIAGPFRQFADALIMAFARPAVATAIQAVAKAFGGLLKALAPQLPGDIQDIATGITRVANAFAKGAPQFAAIISFFFKAAGFALSMIAALTSVADYTEKHFIPAMMDVRKEFDNLRHEAAVIFDGIRHDIAHTWDQIYGNSIGRVVQVVSDVNRFFHNLQHNTASTFDSLRHDIAAAWAAIWSNTTGAVTRGVANVITTFQRLPGRVINALFGLGHQLYAFAHAALDEFWSGFKAVGGAILNWLGNFVSSIIGKVKSLLHIGSPSAVFHDIGMNMMLGLERGIKAGAHRAADAAQSAVGNIKYNPSRGVLQWGPLVRRALVMEGLNPLLAAQVMYQMQTESGGNPNAINNTDINAQRGDPSRGLMQVIGSTFRAYHWPGTSGNIYNPLANIAAALNYARHVYGPTLMSGGMGLGSGHGYALGTLSASAGWAMVGERGPELLHFGGGEQVYPMTSGGSGKHLDQMIALLEELCGLQAANNQITAAAPTATGAGLGAVLGAHARRATYRAMYS